MSMINKSQKLLLAATSVKQHYSSLYTKCILWMYNRNVASVPTAWFI